MLQILNCKEAPFRLQIEQMDYRMPPGTPKRQSTPKESSGALLASPVTPRRKNRVVYSDRFIPQRNGVDLQAAFSLDEYAASVESSNNIQTTAQDDMELQRTQEADMTFNSVLKSELFGETLPSVSSRVSQGQPPLTPKQSHLMEDPSSPGGYDSAVDLNSIASLRTPQRQNGNLLSFQSPSRPSSSSLSVQNELYSLSPVRADSQRMLLSPKRKTRIISKVPYRVLDAPELADDFYLNLVAWGSQDVLAVGLGSAVYLWDSGSGTVNRLCDLGRSESICSLSWIGAGTHLAIGTNSGLVEIWDATTCKCTRTMTGHSMRASSLAWNQHILSSGSRDRSILHRDVREPAHFMAKITAHKQEVCGLKWNVEENKLASGGNDNKLFIWDALNVNEPLLKISEHEAAVKAIAWSPHQRGLLVSGGGTADRRIKMWNVLNGQKVQDIDTGSQVCNLEWSKNSNELVSTHGYSRNQVVIWKYGQPQLQQVASLMGHTYRVLYLALSPDGQTIVTGAGDETLRFWNVFERSRNDQASGSVLLDAFSQLR